MTGELRSAMQELRGRLDDVTRTTWDRSLPFADAMFDRWERAERPRLRQRHERL